MDKICFLHYAVKRVFLPSQLPIVPKWKIVLNVVFELYLAGLSASCSLPSLSTTTTEIHRSRGSFILATKLTEYIPNNEKMLFKDILEEDAKKY